MSPQDDDDPVVGDGSLARRSPVRFAIDAAAAVSGFAVAMGCTHRKPAADFMLKPLAEYTDAECGFAGPPRFCTPAECPLVRIAVERVHGMVSTQMAEGAGRGLKGLWHRFFGPKDDQDAG